MASKDTGRHEVILSAFLLNEMPLLFSFGATLSDTEEARQGRHSYDTNRDTATSSTTISRAEKGRSAGSPPLSRRRTPKRGRKAVSSHGTLSQGFKPHAIRLLAVELVNQRAKLTPMVW